MSKQLRVVGPLHSVSGYSKMCRAAAHAAILLGFEAVFAALAGIIAGMDSVTWRLVVGGSLMLTGVLIVELLPTSKGVVAEIEAEVGPAAGGGPAG